MAFESAPMSALGHVWTAPWQELSGVAAALVRCGHVCGLLMRRRMRHGPKSDSVRYQTNAGTVKLSALCQ